MTEKKTLPWRTVQRRFNHYGHRIGKHDCQRVANSLSAAAVATGWSEWHALDVIARVGPEAVKRVTVLEGVDLNGSQTTQA